MDRVRTIIQAEPIPKRYQLGKGIRVAVLDSGIWQHPDFILPQNRIVLFRDFVHGRSMPYDDYGHGTHVAGIIGGNGRLSNGRYRGIAPECDFVICKILDEKGYGTGLHLLQALQFLRAERKKYGIKVVNLSFCATKEKMEENTMQQEICKELEYASKEGMICVVAAGNNGPAMDSIYFPGNHPSVITVGASDDEHTVYMNGKKQKYYSARGNMEDKKPDLIAPGYRICSCGKSNEIYCRKTGTSMSAPLVTGACTLLSARYPQITVEEVKELLQLSSKDIGKESFYQGAGILQVKTLLHIATKVYGNK